ncbi:hypothetical protein SAMN02745121_06886 [Nannocystis exedens]|uniref:Uncharacterized protein n=2 Tax=Nannocystis exedens TaxID=54 RepID=A0A1I2FUY1_9BACT|nr:hypothetical protein NAEX_06857 [Nannocystis exedens]SFF09244.1 hypothetical protein SAMN02745121_06886 [Nannocystis exedens]
MISSTTPRSGNIPLILLGSERVQNLDPTLEYPYAFSTCNAQGIPIVETVSLHAENSQKSIALWLPTPLLPIAEQPERSLTIVWAYSSWGIGNGTIHDPTFQVILRSRPSRPAGSAMRFTSKAEQVFQLSTEVAAPNPSAFFDHWVTTIEGIKGAGELAPHGEDFQCYLRVKLPARASGSPTSIRWQIHGLAVDQW